MIYTEPSLLFKIHSEILLFVNSHIHLLNYLQKSKHWMAQKLGHCWEMMANKTDICPPGEYSTAI